MLYLKASGDTVQMAAHYYGNDLVFKWYVSPAAPRPSRPSKLHGFQHCMEKYLKTASTYSPWSVTTGEKGVRTKSCASKF